MFVLFLFYKVMYATTDYIWPNMQGNLASKKYLEKKPDLRMKYLHIAIVKE